jgi:hypothetical protein
LGVCSLTERLSAGVFIAAFFVPPADHQLIVQQPKLASTAFNASVKNAFCSLFGYFQCAAMYQDQI